MAAAVALVVAACAVELAPVAAAQAPPPGGSPAYRPPVDAPVLDPFRAPATPYAAGNRGIDYDTVSGSPVGAIADGTVLFAGPVAGALHVTVLHADGLRSSSSFLAEVRVRAGDVVVAGQEVGVAGEVVHLGVRDPLDQYLDPMELFGGATRRAVLVPGGDDGARTFDPSRERRTLAGVAVDGFARVGGALAGGVRAVRGGGPAGAAALAHQLVEAHPAVHAARITRHVLDRTLLAGPCTPPAVPVAVPSERRVAVLVGGFGSTSDHAGVDAVAVGSLGYEPADVLRFSYAGGRTTPDGGAPGPLGSLDATTYDAADSQDDLPTAGARLADLLADVSAAQPGVPIDVIAHSQGGVVARLAVDGAHRRGLLPAEVGHVITLGTPHRGADLATAAASLGAGPAGSAPLDLLAALGVPVDPSRPALGQLAEVSPVIAGIADRPPPPGVRLTSIAARGDLVVTAHRSAVVGGDHVVVPGGGLDAHDALPGSGAATREIALALSDAPPTCESVADVLADAIVADGLGWAEDRLGLAAGLAAAQPGAPLHSAAFGAAAPGS